MDFKKNTSANKFLKISRTKASMFCAESAYFRYIFFLFSIFYFFSPGISVFAADDAIIIHQQVTGTCNNNGVCEPLLGETSGGCLSDCPLPTPTPTPAPTASLLPGGGVILIPDATPPSIYNLFIAKITLNSAEIIWETNEASLCQLFWGQTHEYEKESISENAFYLQHSIKLINLPSQNIYFFMIACKDASQNKAEIKNQSFITLSPFDTTPPADVSNFQAIPSDEKIILKWQNPPDPDFKETRIMRSEKSYITNPWDGMPVYRGKENSFIDNKLVNGVKYYYTVFTSDSAGNISSGTTVSAISRKTEAAPAPSIFIPYPASTENLIQIPETSESMPIAAPSSSPQETPLSKFAIQTILYQIIAAAVAFIIIIIIIFFYLFKRECR